MSLQLMYIGGVVDSAQIPQLRKFIIRATRCQAYVKTFDCEVPLQDQLVGDDYDQKKSIYVIVCQNANIMEDKIRRICQSFSGVTFDVNINTLNQDLVKAENDRVSTRAIITQSKMTFRDYLE